MLDPQVPSITSTTTAEWVYLRTHPYLEITNTSDPTSGATLTSVTIQLNNTQAGLNENVVPFDVTGLIDPQPGIDPGTGLPSTTLPSITSPVTVTSYNASPLVHSSITLNFANLLPGGSTIFRLDLTPVNPKTDSSFADFRQVFFTTSNATTPSSQNAWSSVTFHTNDESDPNPNTGHNLWNNLPTNLAGQTSFGVAYSCLNSPDTVISLGNTTVSGSNPPVPEPSTMVLASLGLAGVLLGRSRLRVKR